MHPNATNFRHLNIDGRWPGFTWRGLHLAADGSLTLTSLPRRRGAAPGTRGRSNAVGAAGVVSACGDLFYTVPARNALVRVERCYGERQTLLGPTGFRAGLQSPRGVAVS